MPTNNLEGINLSIGLDIKDFKHELTEMKHDLNLLGQEARDFKSVFKSTGDISAMHGYERSLIDLRESLQNAKDELVKLYEEAKAQGLDVTDERVHELIVTMTSFDKKIADTDKKLEELYGQPKSLDGFSELFEDVNEEAGKTPDTLTAIGVALASLGASLVRFALNEARQFVSSIIDINTEFGTLTSGLKALYGDDIDYGTFGQITDEIRRLGTTTIYSATEIAQGMESMAKAGYNAEDSLEAVTASLNLAQATGEDVSTVSSILVDGLHAFGLEAESAGNFASILATAANATNVDVADLGDSLKYAGAVAGQFGYEAKDVATAIAVMGQQGIKGSQAGTTLRTMLTRLATNTSGARDKLKELGISFYDANKNARPLNDIITELRNSLQGADDQTVATTLNVIAGQRALTGLSAIINTSQEDWDKYTLAINDSSEALQNMVNIRTDNLAGDIQILKNNASELALIFGEGLGYSVRGLIQSVTTFLQTPEVKELTVKLGEIIGQLTDELSPVLKDVGEFVLNILTIVTQLWDIMKETGIIDALSLTLQALITILNAILSVIKDILDWASRTIDKIKELIGLQDYAAGGGRSVNLNAYNNRSGAKLQPTYSGGFGDLRSLGFASGGTSNITINVNNNGNMITASTVRSWASIINEELGRQI